MLRNKNFLTLLVEDDSAYQNYFLYSFLELTLFLVRYEFILSENEAGNYFFKRDFSPPGELFSQNPNGARYLDPKYSRWLSVDPALGEYMSGSDAGCGGIYNHVNLSLYHYGGNNPVKYTDPDGLFDVEEIDGKQYITVNYGDLYDFDNAYCAYYNSYKDGTAGNPKVDGIALKGSMNHIFSTDDAIKSYYKELFPNGGWTRGDTENLCSFNGIILGIATGVSIFVCPALTPWFAGALLFNDGVNVVCRSIDYQENPSSENAANLVFAWCGFVFDGVSFGATIGLFTGKIARSPLFSFCLKSNGRPYYAINGYFHICPR